MARNRDHWCLECYGHPIRCAKCAWAYESAKQKATSDPAGPDGAFWPVTREIAEAIEAYQKAHAMWDEIRREGWPASAGMWDLAEERDEAGRRLLRLLGTAVEARDSAR